MKLCIMALNLSRDVVVMTICGSHGGFQCQRCDGPTTRVILFLVTIQRQMNLKIVYLINCRNDEHNK